jgi:hypothetical protein
LCKIFDISCYCFRPAVVVLLFAVLGGTMWVWSADCEASTLSAINLDFLGRGGGTAGLAARTGDPDNLYWNASALAFGSGQTGFAGYMDYLVGVQGGTAGYMKSVSGGLGYGLWISYLSSGSMTRTGFDDPTGQKGETFGDTELVSGLCVGRRVLPYLSLGAGLKVARQDLDDFSTSGLFGDLSMTFKAYSPDPKTSSLPGIYTSYVVRNVEMARWEDVSGEVPVNSEIGVALDFGDPDVVSGLSFYFADKGRREIRWGLEIALSEEFEVRLGYRRRTGHVSDDSGNLPWERGLTAGFGLGFGPLRIDYTFEDASPLDNIHRFALRSPLGGAGGN